MLLGKIIGKVNTLSFKFLVEKSANKFDFTQVMHKEYGYVLCQIIELEKEENQTTAKCIVIGYKDEQGRIKPLRTPLEPGTEVLKAEQKFISEITQLHKEKEGAYIGILEGTDIQVFLNLNKLLTKHIAVLAKSGSGKSYSVGVLLEEILEKKVPLLVIDPHGEYSSLKLQNDEKEDLKQMKRFGISPKSYQRQVQEYGDIKVNNELKPLKLNEVLTTDDLTQMIPAKLSNAQLALLYSAVKDLENITLTNLILELQRSESNLKWNMMNIIEHLQNTELFAESYTDYNELIQSGKCSIINLKGIAPEIQEIIVHKLLKDLFEERKKNKIPPFFAVIEEAHNFIPEKGFDEARSAKILRTIASEGRKFGLGLCLITQRPARIEKNALSQVTTQIILKVTNPNDLKAISNSVEGITYETENEIKNLPIGTALITGIVDMPLFVRVRPRKTKHGGAAVNMLELDQDEKFFDELEEFNEKELMPIVKPKLSIKDISIMNNIGQEKIKTMLVPAVMFLCEDKSKEFSIAVDMSNGEVVVDYEDYKTKALPELDKLEKIELKILEKAFHMKSFSEEDMIKKIGSNFNIKDKLVSLAGLGYLTKNKNYSISDKYILSNLSKYAFFDKIQFIKVDYGEKAKKNVSIDKVKNRLNKFTNIKDQREFFLIRYKLD